MRLPIAFLVLCTLNTTLSAAGTDARAAATKSIALMQSVARNWKAPCASCHHQIQPAIALAEARKRGIPVDESLATATLDLTFSRYRNLDEAIQYTFQIDPANDDAWVLMAYGASGFRPSITTAIYAQHIARRQRPEGYWPTIDFRPPSSQSRFMVTAMAIRALDFLPAQMESDKRERVERARKWLESAEPRDTEDMTFRLLGLKWSGASPDKIAAAAETLVKAQRTDGGWAQTPWRASDAYATGEALFALRHAAALPVGDAVFAKGVRYLLDTQKPDGSWHVKTRMHPPAQLSPPYFDSGFPHGRDQFISMSATAWAAIALMQTLDEQAAPDRSLPGIAPKQVPSWLETAMFGSRPELEKLLDGELDPNSATASGTTILMAAAHDLEKVKLLVERGANVKYAAKTGSTALLIASSYSGTTPLLRYLIEQGAPAKLPATIKHKANPGVLAAYTGEVDKLELLARNGSPLDQPMLMLGFVPLRPIEVAAAQADVAVVKKLIALGVDPNRGDGQGLTPLHISAIAGHHDLTQALIASGAAVNQPDKYELTALEYAAIFYHHDGQIARTLIGAGATRIDAAAALAKKYGHGELEPVLSKQRSAGMRRGALDTRP